MGPPLLSCVVSYCLGQGWTFISGPRSYGGGDLRQRGHLRGQRPVEGALGATAEFLVDRRALGGAVGELGDHGVEVEALASGHLLHAAAVGGKLRLELAQELAVRAFVGAAATGGPGTAGWRRSAPSAACGCDRSRGRRRCSRSRGCWRRAAPRPSTRPIVRCRRLGGRRRRPGLLPQWASAQGQTACDYNCRLQELLDHSFTPNALAGNRMRVQQLGAAFKSIYRVSVGEVILPRRKSGSMHGPGRCSAGWRMRNMPA